MTIKVDDGDGSVGTIERTQDRKRNGVITP